MNHHAPISDHDKYNVEMAKSMDEKLFFVNRIRANLWVDFGCADGYLLSRLPDGDMKFGVESNPAQAAIARLHHNVVSSEFWHFAEHIQHYRDKYTTCAIFSLVLHESPELLLQAVNFGFDYIVIRDMGLMDQWRHLETDLNAAFKYPYWGTTSWDREVSEDYFRMGAEGLLYGPDGYNTIYFEHAPVAFHQDRIERDLGLRVEVPTHIKAIWKRNAS